jgi:hypothetical protein
MKEEAASESALRQFLLGNADEEERQRLESLFITDSVVKERILAAEQDLIDDYLDGSLTSAEQQRFIQQYANTSEQRRKLRIATSIKEWATTEGNVSLPPEPVRTSLWSRLRDGVWLKPTVALPIAASAMVLIIALAFWLNSRIERRNQQLTIQEEVVRLNVPENLRVVPSNLSSLELRPVVVRSGASQDELIINPDNGIAELRLVWIRTEQYPQYTATVRRVDGSKSVTIPDLQAEDNGKLIRLRLPDHFLTRGAYQVELTGITANAATGINEEYRFTVRS